MMDLDRAVTACLAGLSPNTQRAYTACIGRFTAWCLESPGTRALNRESVSLWCQEQTANRASGIAVNQALSAVKKLAHEAAELGWLSWEDAIQIGAIKSRKHRGTRSGQWLTLGQARALLASPDRNTLAGQRDACVLALLLGCGIRRAEACALGVGQVVWKQSDDGSKTMQLCNLIGKGNRVRTLGVPAWAARDIAAWIEVAGIEDGKLLRSIK